MGAKPSPSLDTTVFDQVIETGDVADRCKLAAELAGLVADAGAEQAERRAVAPSLLKLALDPVEDVRRQLAPELAGVADLDADLLFTIVADDDTIALPFLAETTALDPWRMLAILEVGDVPRQIVIAARPDITSEAVALIAAKGSLEVVAALLDNSDCHVPNQDYRRLYVRFRDEVEIVERLLRRNDLPLEVRILQAKRASSRIQSLVVERGWIAANDAEAIVTDVEETTVLRILEQAKPEELDRLIPFLGQRDMMNAAIVLRAACRGQMAIVERALSWLSSMSIRQVRALVEGHSRVPLKALFSASGMPKGSYLILKSCAELWRERRPGEGQPSPEQFSRQVVEALMTRHADLTQSERMRLLDLVATLTDEPTRAIATRLKTTLQAA